MYRTRGRDRASQHNTPGTTGLENAGGAGGPGRDAGTRLAGPTRVRRASARKISHIISHGHFSRPPENVAIPTMQIQCLNKLLGNYVRNCSDGSKTPAKQVSHAIRLDQISTNPENVAIPTMQIQCLNKLLGNCMRNCCADGPGRGAGGQRQGRGSVGPGTVPGTVAGPTDATKFARHGPSPTQPATKFAQQPQKRQIWGVSSAQGELFRAPDAVTWRY